MPQDLRKLPHKLDEKGMSCRAVVETPKGYRGKYDYDPKSGLFRLKALLPDGMSFPLDFGFVPSTLGEDGDPVDVMILTDEPCPVGALLDVRLLGVIEAEQAEDGKTQRNDRLLAASAVSNLYAKVKAVDDLDDGFLDNLVQFWINKNRLAGKSFTCTGVGDPRKAAALIRKASKAPK